MSLMTNKHQYVYNPANQRTNTTRTDGSTVAFKYDNIGQLTVADSSVDSEDLGYYYDSAWNLNRHTNSGGVGTFLVDNKNQLTNAPVWEELTYDDNGNLASKYNGIFSYAYDDENRLTEIEVRTAFGDAVWGTLFIYDGLGRLRVRQEYQGAGDSWSCWRRRGGCTVGLCKSAKLPH